MIKETLRLFPALGINLTKIVPKGGLTLGGRHFPEGVRPPLSSFPPTAHLPLLTQPHQTIVGINIWVAHANQSVFGPDADTFRPERWLESPEKISKMEQYFLTVSIHAHIPIPLCRKCIEIMEIVRQRSTNVYWKEHSIDGIGEIDRGIGPSF